jgi:hypothetical protein
LLAFCVRRRAITFCTSSRGKPDRMPARSRRERARPAIDDRDATPSIVTDDSATFVDHRITLRLSARRAAVHNPLKHRKHPHPPSRPSTITTQPPSKFHPHPAKACP